MLRDHTLPPELSIDTRRCELRSTAYEAACWRPEALRAVAEGLRDRGARALARLPDAALLDAWSETVEAFLDPTSEPRRELAGALVELCRLSPQGLAAGLEAVLGGVSRKPAARLAAAAEGLRGAVSGAGPVLVILASNLPALAVQPLLPALLRRRPVLLKSPSAEPLFAPAFIAALTRREPRLADALAAVTWPGGDRDLEAPVLAAVAKVVAYGDGGTLDDLRRRCPAPLIPYGPRTSLAVIGAGVSPATIAAGLARDVALFDQRGCLSIQAIYTAGDARALADTLARELAVLGGRWPAGPADLGELAAVQQVRAEADLRGLHRPSLALDTGTVVVDPDTSFQPSPGRRTVRIHPLARLNRLPAILAPWSGRLQGAALAGTEALALRPALEALGCSRFAPPGELQSPDATWHNGGLHPLEALG